MKRERETPAEGDRVGASRSRDSDQMVDDTPIVECDLNAMRDDADDDEAQIVMTNTRTHSHSRKGTRNSESSQTDTARALLLAKGIGIGDEKGGSVANKVCCDDADAAKDADVSMCPQNEEAREADQPSTSTSTSENPDKVEYDTATPRESANASTSVAQTAPLRTPLPAPPHAASTSASASGGAPARLPPHGPEGDSALSTARSRAWTKEEDEYVRCNSSEGLVICLLMVLTLGSWMFCMFVCRRECACAVFS